MKAEQVKVEDNYKYVFKLYKVDNNPHYMQMVTLYDKDDGFI